MKGRGVALLRAIGAIVLLLLLVVGVPLLLILVVGNPFPSSMPTINEIRILLTQNGQGFANFIVGVLAIIIWFIWAQLIVALIVEVVATIQHSETRRLPAAPGIQLFAAKMIAAITLATTIATAPILAPAVGALSFGEMAPVSAVTSLVSSGAQTTMMADAVTTGVFHDYVPNQVVDEIAPRVVLSDQTELWDLAEAAYGDGVSWKLIAEANAGLVDAQGVMVTSDTEVVPSGTELALPGITDVLSVAAFGFAAEPGAEAVTGVGEPSGIASDMHVVVQGDSMWSVAEDMVAEELDRDPSDAEVAEYWSDVVASNDSLPSGDIDLIHPGEELVLPAMPNGDAGQVEAAPVDDVGFAEGDLPDLAGVVDGPVDAQNIAPENLADTDVADTEVAGTGVAGTDVADSEVVETDIDEAGDSADDDLVVWVASDANDDDTDNDQAADATSTDSAAAPDSAEAAALAQAEATPPPGVFDGSVAVDDESATDDLPVRAVGLAVLGSAILLTGVHGALRRRRALQRRMRPPGALVPAPSSEAAAFAAAIEHGSHHVRQSEHGYGWRMLPVEAVSSLRAVGPLEIRVDESGRLFALSVDQTDTSVVQRFDLDATSSVADLDDQTDLELTDLELSGPATEWPDPDVAGAPTAVVAGTDPASGEAVLIDLASVGELSVDGDDDSVLRFTRSAVLDLATSERADDVRVIAVNVAEGIEDLDRVCCVTSYAEALEQLKDSGHGSPDAETPVVVVSSHAPDADDESVTQLRDLGACIVAPGLDESSQVTVDGDHAVLEPAGSFVNLAALDDASYGAVVDLIDATQPNTFDWPEGQTIAVEDVLDVPVATDCPVEAGPVEVKVLGPVEIAGAKPFSSLKAVDVITYLAFHRHGADADQLKTWVWPPFDPPTDKALANVLSRARTGLGSTDQGAPYLSKAGSDKTYRLDPSATTDFDRFRALVELAHEASDTDETLGLYKQALELIRGVPFTGGSASSFAWTDNHVRALVEFTIDEAVHRCADLALENNDLTTARWAALKGLELVPGCEQCFKRRFLVAEAGNNRSELRRAMTDLERSAAVDLGEPEAVDTISEELLDLYHQLDRALVAGSS